jgi:CheY-like chemotaxis protein
MTESKPSMLVAEDSDIAALYKELFGNEFAVTVAQTGEEAFASVDESQGFDISIVDIIMPVENEARTLCEADTTGLRLIEYLISQRKCGRFVVITVRWDIAEELSNLIAGSASYVLLLKTQADEETIRSGIAKLMSE